MGRPAWWTQRRFGLLLHTNLASVPSWAPIGQYADWYRAHCDGSAKDVLLHPSPLVETLQHHRDRWGHVERYEDFLPFLGFEEFDPDAWAGLARDAGMGYAVVVAKHHDGLCWWDAPGTERTVLHGGPRRNVLGELAAACERADLVFGTHYSLLDWADPRYPTCRYVEEVVHPQVLDLVERYGSKMLWGDGHWGAGASHWRSDELVARARAIDPEIVVNDRWWADGPVVRSFEYRTPPGILDVPWEMRRGVGASFGYNRAEGPDHLLEATDLVAVLTEVVAKGGHLLLSIGADASGRIPELHAERVRAAGGWVRRHRDLVDRGQPWVVWGDERCRYLVVDGILHVVDVGGRGQFADLRPGVGRVRAITTLDGDEVEFVQGADGVTLARSPRRTQRMPQVYRVDLEPVPPPPVALFADEPPTPVDLSEAFRDAAPGSIVQLGEGTYLGPARVPDGVTVRGLGSGRTRIDGIESVAVTLGAGSRLEHVTMRGGGERIVWLPKTVVRVTGRGASMLGCVVEGHIEVQAADVRIVSCHVTGVVGRGADRTTLSRSTFRGMHWDWAIDLEGGSGHLVESCDFADVLAAIRLTGTVGATMRGNTIEARWWGAHLVDTIASRVVGNHVERTMRAVDVDGGTLAEVTGNAAMLGDSGCVVQRGATDCEVAGNHWDRCRVGLLVWEAGAVRAHDNTCIDLGEPEHGLVEGP
jgi:alpha-L-fucosidase